MDKRLLKDEMPEKEQYYYPLGAGWQQGCLLADIFVSAPPPSKEKFKSKGKTATTATIRVEGAPAGVRGSVFCD